MSHNTSCKITRNDISYNPNRDPHMESFYGTDSKFITKTDNDKRYSITLYLKSQNPDHYTEFGWISLLEAANGKPTTQWLLSHLQQIRISGHNDHAKSPTHHIYHFH